MGRNYIKERTWADPKERAAQKSLKRERQRKRRIAEIQSLKQYLKRSSVCWVKGCGKPTNVEWLDCCSELCHAARTKELDRRAEVKEARQRGIPVAEFRKQNQK